MLIMTDEGSPSRFIQKDLKDLYTKFGAFILSVTILHLNHPTIGETPKVAVVNINIYNKLKMTKTMTPNSYRYNCKEFMSRKELFSCFNL